MAKKWPWLVAGSVAAGLAIGLSTRREPAAPTPQPPPPASLPAREITTSKWISQDFLNAAKEHAGATAFGTQAQVPDLSDWTTDEIRTALDASLTEPDCVLRGGKATHVPKILLGEWMRRDLSAALAWFEALQSSSAKERLATAVSEKWPPGRALEGLMYLKDHPDLFPRGAGSALVQMNLQQAAYSGPLALAGILGLCHQGQLHGGIAYPYDFPANFDFTLLLSTDQWHELGDDPLATTVIHAWQARDPDLAFDWLLGQKGPKSLVMLADNYLNSQHDPGTWLAGKIEQLRPDEQREFLDAAKDQWLRSPSRLVSFSRAVSDPLILDEVGTWGAQATLRDMESGLSTIEAIPGVERRLDLLEAVTTGEYLGHDSTRRNFGPSDEALLRKKLAEWEVSADRIDAIVTRFRP